MFLTDDPGVAPFALRILLEREHVLHEHTVLLSWRVEDTPAAAPREATVHVERLGHSLDGLIAVDVTLGYRERLDVEHVLARAAEQEDGLLEVVDPGKATYFVSDPIPILT